MSINLIILGNILGFVGSIFMVLASNSKKQNNVVKLQIFQLAFLGISNLVLGAFTGFLSSVVSIARNVICVKGKMNNIIKSTIVGFFIVSAIFFNEGIIGWLPVIASVTLTIGLDLKNQKAFRTALLVSSVSFMIFDLAIQNYITFVFDIVTVALAVYRLVKTFQNNNDIVKKENNLLKKVS